MIICAETKEIVTFPHCDNVHLSETVKAELAAKTLRGVVGIVCKCGHSKVRHAHNEWHCFDCDCGFYKE